MHRKIRKFLHTKIIWMVLLHGVNLKKKKISMYLIPSQNFKRWKCSIVKRILMYSAGAELINAILFYFQWIFSCLLVLTLTIPNPMELQHLVKKLSGSIIYARYFLFEKWEYFKRQHIPYAWILRHRTLSEVKQYLWMKRRNWWRKLIGENVWILTLKWPFYNIFFCFDIF